MEQTFSQTQIQAQKQEQNQVQIQTLTPQQLLQVKLTEMSVRELEERVEKELVENTALEESDLEEEGKKTEEDEFSKDEFGEEDEFNDSNDEEYADKTEKDDDFSGEKEYDDRRNDYASDDDTPDYILRSTYNSSEPVYMPLGGQESFYENLVNQIGEHEVTEKQRTLLEYLIGSLDDDGLLRKNLDSISMELDFNEDIQVTREELEEVVKILQTFDPVGIGATSIAECLILQLDALPDQNDTVLLAKKILTKRYDDFINKRFEKLKKFCQIDDEQLADVMKVIRRLDPHPGSSFGDSVNGGSQAVIPDFKVTQDDEGNLSVSLNQGEVPTLRISESYKASLAEYEKNRKNLSHQQKDAAKLMKMQVDSAKGFINAILQRRDTLMRTMTAIVELQRNFFLEGGDENLNPMKLEDVAQKTGLDKSTISRVSKSKYVETIFGIFPLKHFFNVKFSTSADVELSQIQVKSKLREIIDGESKKRPLSDDAITMMLNQAGLPVARRTVAKYREKMGIPVARLRKQ